MLGNERGIALVITLLIVSLLTITVIEFTYSVQIDQHMARNALSSLQASLLARSGINLGEAFLLHDDDRSVDAFTEEWCPDHSPDGHACRIDETNGEVLLPPNMRLRVQIVDEGGKLNLNLVSFQNPTEWSTYQKAPENQKPKQVEARKEALQRLLSSRGVDPTIADQLFEYWDLVYQSRFPNMVGGVPGQVTPGAPTPKSTPGTEATPDARSSTLEFASLDDASVIPGLTPTALRRLRPVMTALPKRQRVNINTAPVEVLQAILDDEGAVSDIVAQRTEAPMKTLPQGGNISLTVRMLGITSFYYQVRASGIVNPNPVTGRGGIGRSATMLVERTFRTQQGGSASAVPWTLRQLDWQKEGGAVLFQPQGDQEPGTEEEAPPGSLG